MNDELNLIQLLKETIEDLRKDKEELKKEIANLKSRELDEVITQINLRDYGEFVEVQTKLEKLEKVTLRLSNKIMNELIEEGKEEEVNLDDFKLTPNEKKIYYKYLKSKPISKNALINQLEMNKDSFRVYIHNIRKKGLNISFVQEEDYMASNIGL